MAISTYDDLVAAIRNFMMDRSDLTANAPDFISLGEGVINYGFDGGAFVPALRAWDMETVVNLTPDEETSVCTLPLDYLEYKRVVELASRRRPLAYLSEEGTDELYPSRTGGLACHFSIVGSSLTALPLSQNSIELTYYASVPALNSGAPTNWLLAKHPGIYLRASLFMAAEWMKDMDEMTKQASMLAGLVSSFNARNNLAKFANSGVTVTSIPVW